MRKARLRTGALTALKLICSETVALQISASVASASVLLFIASLCLSSASNFASAETKMESAKQKVQVSEHHWLLPTEHASWVSQTSQKSTYLGALEKSDSSRIDSDGGELLEMLNDLPAGYLKGYREEL